MSYIFKTCQSKYRHMTGFRNLHGVDSSLHSSCVECCSTDSCNSHGCGQPGGWRLPYDLYCDWLFGISSICTFSKRIDNIKGTRIKKTQDNPRNTMHIIRRNDYDVECTAASTISILFSSEAFPTIF